MKIILSICLLIYMSSAKADDNYSHMVYTAAAFMYWCKFKEVAKNKNDFAKVTKVNELSPKLTLAISDWFKSVEFKIDGEKLKVIRKPQKSANGITSNRTSTSTSNCASHI